MYVDHPNLTPEVNAAIRDSELAGGVFIKNLPIGTTVKVQTNNTLYTIDHNEDGDYIQGSPKYCPERTKASIHGSTFGGSMIKVGWIGVGMYLEFSTPEHGTIGTSKIQSFEIEKSN
jgi:hypothetical protein